MNPEPWSGMGPELPPVFWVTIKLAITSATGSLISDTLLTAMRVSLVGILRTLSTWCVSIVRSTPLTLIMLLASMGLYYNLSLLLAAESDSFIVKWDFCPTVLAFIAYTSCFVAESLRAGINIVPFGQAGAVRSLGLSFSQSFHYIVPPQAFHGVIVSPGSALIVLTGNTTITSVIGVAEVSLLIKTVTENCANDILIIFGIIAIGFITLTLPTGPLFGWAGKRWAVKH